MFFNPSFSTRQLLQRISNGSIIQSANLRATQNRIIVPVENITCTQFYIYGRFSKGIAQNIYVAVFSDGVVKKIDGRGNMVTVYKSKGEWAPLHGVFDNNKLWLLESSDKNEIRVTLVEWGQAIKG